MDADECVWTLDDSDSEYRWGDIMCDMRPHHTDELDELQAHSYHHWVLEVIDRTDDLIVALEEGFNQACFIRGGPGST